MFNETAEFIQDQVLFQTFTLKDVFQNMLEIVSGREYYTKRHLWTLLKDHFGGQLEFIQKGTRYDVLCFRSTAKKIISDFHKRYKSQADCENSGAEDLDPKVEIIRTAAKLLLDDAKSSTVHQSTNYPETDNLYQEDPCVPESFRCLLQILFPSRPMFAEIWAQCLFRNVLPRAPPSPFQLANSLHPKRKYNSKASLTISQRLVFVCLTRSRKGIFGRF